MSDNSNDKIKGLFNWCVNQTKGYKNVEIRNFSNSWKNGLGFCAILHRYGPDLIDFDKLCPENIYENCDLAFNIAEKHFGIPSLLSPKDMVIMKSPDRLCMITYLSQYYNTLASKHPSIITKKEPNLLSVIENLNKEATIKEQKSIDEEGNENNPSLTEERSENPLCAICSEIIYFLEKMTVADKFYHRSCYRQNQLTNLKIRNKTLERPPVSEQVNVSNSKDDKPIPTLMERSSRSKSSSFNKTPPVTHKSARPPSLNSNLSENILLENNKLKSLNNQSEDHSSQSASSVNYISVNASSVESLSQNTSDLPPKIDENVHMFSNKLHPSSLDNSSNSLNSSFSKKRQAPPPPPITKPRHSFLKPNTTPRPVSHETKVIQYPEELNPFAIKDEIISTKTVSSDIDSSNPFAEYMNDENLNTTKKPIVKPHKRPAPKLPPKMTVVTTSKSSEPIVHSDVSSDKIINSSLVPSSNVCNSKVIETNVNLSLAPDLSIDNIEQNITGNHPQEIKTDSIASLNDKSENNLEEIKIDSPLQDKFKNQCEDRNLDLKLDIPADGVIDVITTKIKKNSETIFYDLGNQTSLSNNSVVTKPENKQKQKTLVNKCKSEDALNELGSSKRSVHKPPAPARPLPPKREVRGDTSYEFIPYESLYSQLKELNEKQSQIEIEGRTLQNTLWEADQNGGKFEELLQGWLDLVEKKNDLYVKEGELHEILRRQELEDRHADLEYELRFLMGKQESQKTAAEKAREEELINQILDTVNARAQLIEQQNNELLSKSSTNEIQKSKNTLKNFFSIKRRSSSVGKIRTIRSKTFKFNKKKKQETFTLH